VSGDDPVNVLADEIMGPDRVKAVGYWLQVDGELKFIETRPAKSLVAMAGRLIVDKGQA
jgi:hypothetical protein